MMAAPTDFKRLQKQFLNLHKLGVESIEQLYEFQNETLTNIEEGLDKFKDAQDVKGLFSNCEYKQNDDLEKTQQAKLSQLLVSIRSLIHVSEDNAQNHNQLGNKGTDFLSASIKSLTPDEFQAMQNGGQNVETENGDVIYTYICSEEGETSPDKGESSGIMSVASKETCQQPMDSDIVIDDCTTEHAIENISQAENDQTSTCFMDKESQHDQAETTSSTIATTRSFDMESGPSPKQELRSEIEHDSLECVLKSPLALPGETRDERRKRKDRERHAANYAEAKKKRQGDADLEKQQREKWRCAKQRQRKSAKTAEPTIKKDGNGKLKDQGQRTTRIQRTLGVDSVNSTGHFNPDSTSDQQQAGPCSHGTKLDADSSLLASSESQHTFDKRIPVDSEHSNKAVNGSHSTIRQYQQNAQPKADESDILVVNSSMDQLGKNSRCQEHIDAHPITTAITQPQGSSSAQHSLGESSENYSSLFKESSSDWYTRTFRGVKALWHTQTLKRLSTIDVMDCGSLVIMSPMSGAVHTIDSTGEHISVTCMDVHDINFVRCLAVSRQTGHIVVGAKTNVERSALCIFQSKDNKWRQIDRLYTGHIIHTRVAWTTTADAVVTTDGFRLRKYNIHSQEETWTVNTQRCFSDMAVDSQGIIYCCDFSIIRVYSSTGSFLSQINTYTMPVRLSHSVCLDSKDRLLVLHYMKDTDRIYTVNLYNKHGKKQVKLVEITSYTLSFGELGSVRLYKDSIMYISCCYGHIFAFDVRGALNTSHF